MNAVLEAALSDSGLDARPDARAVERVAAYIQLRDRWSAIHNIAGPRSLAGAWSVDVVDSVAIWSALHPGLALVDVGAGSGVPGLVLAALEPEREVHLVEPLAKRTAFLRTALRALELKHVTVHRARWPVDLGTRVQVASRAVVSPDDWPRLALAGGDAVRSVLRMLARDRPDPGLAAWTLAAGVDYSVPSGARRVERWDRPPTPGDLGQKSTPPAARA